MRRALSILFASLILTFLSFNCAMASMFEEGAHAYSQGNYVRAERCFRQALISEPNNMKLRYYMAIALVKNRKNEEARYNYRYIVATAPNSEMAYWAKVGLGLIGGSSSSGYQRTANSTEVNFSTQSSAIVINNVVINGSNAGSFIMDTGATYILISTELARKLHINTANAPKVSMVTANGRIDASKVILNSVSINGVQARNVVATVSNFDTSGGAQGLLGLSFLHNFKVTIDRSSGKVKLEKN